MFKIMKTSDLCDEKYAQAFFDYIERHRELVLIKGTKTWPDVFEYGHVHALKAMGKNAECIGEQQKPFDVIMESEKHSLKTETRKNLKLDRVHLTKLMTASWLRHLSLDEVIDKITNHISSFDRLLVLRAKHGTIKPIVVVELVEIPKILLNTMTHLTQKDFSAWTCKNGRIGSSKATFRDLYTITLEATASKINLDVARSQCICHAQFKFTYTHLKTIE